VSHHPKDVGVAVLLQNFTGAFAGVSGIAVVDTGHGSSPGFRFYCTLLYRLAVSIRNSIPLMTLDQQLGPPRKFSRAVERELVFGWRFRRRKVRQSRHARVKMPPHYYSTLARSIFAEWGLNQGE
jgi:hypothetical protein